MGSLSACHNHPGMEQAELCRACGIHYCEDCLEQMGPLRFCADCAQETAGPTSRRSIAAVVVAVTGLVVPLLACLGMLLSCLVMFDVRRGKASVQDMKWATTGTVVGGMGVGLWCVSLLA